MLAIAAGAEIFRLGFFADDFHFLDVARRIPLGRALGGQYGIYPWYRPLSRELYFAIVEAAGPAAAFVARALSLAAVAASVLLVDRIGRRLLDPRAGRVAAILFATYAFTRFLAAWASGFQDLLGLMLTLWAIDAMLEGRLRLAIAAAVLAPFAKEPSVVVFPFLALLALRPGFAGHRVRAFAALAGGFALVIAAHLAVRAAWHGGGTTATIVFAPRDLVDAVVRVVRGFVGVRAVLEPTTVGLAMAAAVLAGIALAAARPDAATPGGTTPAGSRSRAYGLAFAGLAAVLGVLPLVGGNLMRWNVAHAYYAFPAAPWIALLLGAGLAALRPRALVTVAVALLAGWNVLALGVRRTNLSTAPGWQFQRWDWNEAVRLSDVSARLRGDLRDLLAARPESLVVLFSGLPAGSYFQTEDGPAVRVALDDPTARSYWINAAPYDVRPGHVRLLEFDPRTLHLSDPDFTLDLMSLSATSVAAGEPGGAAAFYALADSAQRATPQMCLFRAAAALEVEGPDAYMRELRRGGLDDTTGEAPARVAARLLFDRPSMLPPMERVLRSPRNAEARLALAHAFEPLGGWVSAAVELRVALALERRPASDSLELGRVLQSMGNQRRAREVFASLAVSALGTPVADSARARIDGIDRQGGGKSSPPVRALGKPIPR